MPRPFHYFSIVAVFATAVVTVSGQNTDPVAAKSSSTSTQDISNPFTSETVSSAASYELSASLGKSQPPKNEKHRITVGGKMDQAAAEALQQSLRHDGYKNIRIVPEGAKFSVQLSDMTDEEALAAEKELKATGYKPLGSPLLPDATKPQKSKPDERAIVRQMRERGYAEAKIARQRAGSSGKSAELQAVQQELKRLQEKVAKLNAQSAGLGAKDPVKGTDSNFRYELRVATGINEEECEELVKQLKNDGMNNLGWAPTKSRERWNVWLKFETEQEAANSLNILKKRGYQFGTVTSGKIIRKVPRDNVNPPIATLQD